MVGIENSDDAGVVRLTPDLALVQTVDFFTPIVDDPYWFGRIAAANSLSDIYAMGAKPLTALNIVCFPIKDADPLELGEILRGGADTLREAGVLLLGGHSVDDPEPKFGLAVTGTVHPAQIATNAGARPGDLLVLTKPIGTGIITTAAMQDQCPPDALDAAVKSMATLNASAADAIRAIGIPHPVHAVTDITGFGLLGHLSHWIRANPVRITLETADIPLLPQTQALAETGFTTGGGASNRRYVGQWLETAPGIEDWAVDVLSDPQTSGGLCIAVDAQYASRLVEELQRLGTPAAAIIGSVEAGPASLVLR